MADYYVKSSTGLDTNDGLSWATAKTTIASVIAIPCVAGDRIFVPASHNETQASAKTLVFPGTPALPNQLICVVDDNATALSTGGNIATTGLNTLAINGSVVVHGATLASGSGTSTAHVWFNQSSGDGVQRLDTCTIHLNGANTGTQVAVGNGASSNAAKGRSHWRNVSTRFSHLGQSILVYQTLNWEGGKVTTTAAALTSVLRVGAQGRTADVRVSGVDFSELPTGFTLVSGAVSAGNVLFRNCKMPVGWTGGLVGGVHSPGLRVTMHNCDSSDTTYRMLVADYYGTVRSETAVVKTGGANAYGTGVSWAMISNPNTTAGIFALESDEIFCEISTVGAAVTVSVDVLTDGITLTNADVWLDVQYLGTSGVPLGVFSSSRAPLLSAPVSLPTNTSATWAASGLVSQVKQKLSVTFTPQEAGFVHLKVMLARPSTTMYVDPLAQVS